MDQSVKTLIQVIIIFVGLILMISCVSFFIIATDARSTMYSVIQHIEIYGYQPEVIQQYADETNTTIQVRSLENNQDKGNRYQVSVSFQHIFSFIRLKKDITYTSLTRLVQY